MFFVIFSHQQHDFYQEMQPVFSHNANMGDADNAEKGHQAKNRNCEIFLRKSVTNWP
jgi:hypothetical protein